MVKGDHGLTKLLHALTCLPSVYIHNVQVTACGMMAQGDHTCMCIILNQPQ